MESDETEIVWESLYSCTLTDTQSSVSILIHLCKDTLR